MPVPRAAPRFSPTVRSARALEPPLHRHDPATALVREGLLATDRPVFQELADGRVPGGALQRKEFALGRGKVRFGRATGWSGRADGPPGRGGDRPAQLLNVSHQA